MPWVYLLKRKSDVSHILPNFINIIRDQFGVNIKGFRTDNARDYFNQILSPYLEKEEIIHQSSCVNTPHKMGWQKEKIDISLKLLELYFSNIKFQKIIGRSRFNLYVFDKSNTFMSYWFQKSFKLFIRILFKE
jgi:hypothetical protein